MQQGKNPKISDGAWRFIFTSVRLQNIINKIVTRPTGHSEGYFFNIALF